MEKDLEKKLHRGVEEIKEIRLTAREREGMLFSILSAPAAMPVRTPYYRERWVMIFLPALLVVILSSGVVFASSSSLPDGKLYSVKVNVLEKVHAAFIFSSESSAEYQSSLATERLREAETLAQSGKLHKSEETKINSLLAEHTQALKKNLKALHKKNSKREADIAAGFEADMNVHADALDNLESEERGDEKEKISHKARENGALIRGILEDREELDKGEDLEL